MSRRKNPFRGTGDHLAQFRRGFNAGRQRFWICCWNAEEACDSAVEEHRPGSVHRAYWAGVRAGMRESKAMTANDLRVLKAANASTSQWDGFAPHGAGDWKAVRRLSSEGLLESAVNRWRFSREGHDTAIYVITGKGRAALRAAMESEARR